MTQSRTLTVDQVRETQHHTLSKDNYWRKLPKIGGIAGMVLLGAAFAIGWGGDKQNLLFSYLTAYIFFLSIPLGALFFIIINHLTRASWSVVTRRVVENITATFPLFAVLFIPIAMNLQTIYYKWADPEVLANDHHAGLVEHKNSYLSSNPFLIRAVLFLAAWALISWWFRKKSVAQDNVEERSANHKITRQMQVFSAPALAIFSMTLTFASFDWIMSLDPHWFSTIFGIYYFSGCVVAFFAALALIIINLRKSGALNEIVTAEHDQDIGKFLFGFNVFWSYIAFSQYILIWYANIPEETAWFADRNFGTWANFSLMLAFCHFLIPFFFLLTRHTKRRPVLLGLASAWLLLMHFADIYWLVMPTIHAEGVQVSLYDVLTLLGIGGLFVGFLAFWMKRDAIVPIRDPRLGDSIALQNV